MDLYENNNKRKEEDDILACSGHWLAVKAAQETARSWKRITIVAVLVVFALIAPAFGSIVRVISSYL